MKKTMNAILTLLIIIIISNIAYSEFEIAPSQNSLSLEKTTLENNFVVSTYSITNDFSVSAREEISICSCDEYIDTITIENIGSKKDSYRITFDQDYSSLNSIIITLDKGESAKVKNYLKSICSEKKGEMKTYVESTSGNLKILSQKMNIATCSNINVSEIKTQSNTTPCKKVETSFMLQNPSNFAEEYTITLEKYDTLQNMSQASIILNKGERKKVTIEHNLPCEVYGKYSSDITITTSKTELETKIPVKINISRKYDYEISAQNKTTICSVSDEKIPIKIKNKENFENTISLTLPFNFGYSLEEKEVTLKPNEEKTVYIIKKTKKPSKATLDITSKSKLGGIEKKITLEIESKECYKSEISYEKQNLCQNDYALYFKIKNTGEKKSNFLITSKDKNVLNIFQKNITLFPNEEKTIAINTNISKPGEYKFNINIASDYGMQKTLKANTRKLTNNECYKIEFESPDKILLKNTSFIQNATIKNSGQKDSSYALYTNQKGAEFLENQTSIRHNTEKNTFMIINPSNIGNISKITLYAKSVESGEIYKKTVKIVNPNNTLSSKIKRAIDSSSSFFKNNAKMILYTIAGIIIVFAIIIAIIMLVAVKRKNDDKKKKLVTNFYSSKKRKRKTRK